ncbi:hypothetical protein OKW31_007000 [Paraburkholderia atlantica]
MCRQIPVVCFPAVLLPCVISNTYHIDISRPDTLTATEPECEEMKMTSKKRPQSFACIVPETASGPARTAPNDDRVLASIYLMLFSWQLLRQFRKMHS